MQLPVFRFHHTMHMGLLDIYQRYFKFSLNDNASNDFKLSVGEIHRIPFVLEVPGHQYAPDERQAASVLDRIHPHRTGRWLSGFFAQQCSCGTSSRIPSLSLYLESSCRAELNSTWSIRPGSCQRNRS